MIRAYTGRRRPATLNSVTVPVTCRLDQKTLDRLDRAVIDGAAPTRAALVALAITEWLELHDEELIAESYRRAYAAPDPELDALTAAALRTSVKAIFGAEGDDAPR